MSKTGKIKFNAVSSPEVKLSDDRLSACRKCHTEISLHSYVFSDQCLSVKEDFQIQIINMISLHSESLQFGVVSENPTNLNKFLSDKEISLKNSLTLRKNVLYHQNEENVITSEEYDLDLSNLREGDLIGLQITENGELYFTFNGIVNRKAADNIPKNIWAFVNFNGRCTFISIIPSNNSITVTHKEKLLTKMTEIMEPSSINNDTLMSFHNFCGKEVILTNDNRVAKRKNPTNEFRNAVVISNSALVTNEMFKLRIEGLINKWNGSIELGVTFHNPDMFDLPTAMNNLRSGTLVLSGNSILTNGHGTRLPYCTTSLDDLKIGDEVGIVRKNNGNVHFFINNDDMGVAGNITIDKDLWVIADLYGRTIKVSIVNETAKRDSTETVIEPDINVESSDDGLVFNTICGKNIKLSNDKTRACRINDQEFNNGVMFTHRPLRAGELWAVKLVRCVEQWAGNMEVGVTTQCPMAGEIPSTMTDMITAYTLMLTSNGLVINGSPLSMSSQLLNQDDIHPILLSGIPCLVEGNIIGVQLLDNLNIQFYINGADLGIMTLETEQELYGVIDLYGKAAEVSLCCDGLYNNRGLMDKSFNSTINEDNISEIDSASNYQSLLYSEENNDFGRGFRLLQTESGLCDALKEADRSFLRLLSGNDSLNTFLNDSSQEPLVFHHAHGRNVILTNDGRTAFRPSPYNEFKNALVMSSRPLEVDEIFEICVDKMTDHWSGSLEMGVTLNSPVELNFPGTLSQLDKDCWILSGSCIMNNGITARNDYSLDMDAITVNSKIGLIRRRTGMLHFLLNGKDMGAAYFDVPSGIYAILDLYGQCSKVSITSNTGTILTSEHSAVSLLETPNCTSLLIKEPELILQSNDKYNASMVSPSRLSPFDRVMHIFKENISGLSEDEGVTVMSRRLDINNSRDRASFDDVDLNSQWFNGDCIFGDGVRWTESHGFKADNQKRNCIVQSKYQLKAGVFHEFVFNISENQNSNPISFGFTTEKFSSQRNLAEDLFQVNHPNWIFVGEKLFIDNKLHSCNLSSALSTLKRRLLLGIYLHDNNSLELFVDRITVGLLELNNHRNLYMLLDLSGWYDCVTTMDIGHRVNVGPILLEHILQRPHSNYLMKGEVASGNIVESPATLVDGDEMCDLIENIDSDDPLMITILKELYELLPLFMISLKCIETSRLIERIVVSNNDIVLNIKKEIERGRFQRFIHKENIRNLLIYELSKRFSHLKELRGLGNSHYEIARVLRRQVLTHFTCYDSNAKASVVTQSCLRLEESRLCRSEPGCEFGLGIINQELKSEKYKSYEFHLSNSKNEQNSGLTNNSFTFGLIIIETKHFRNAEDAFKFLLSIPSPKHINSMSNYINLQLGLFESELPALVLVVKDDSVFLNGRQICQKMPFNTNNISTNQFLQFKLRESDCDINDVYLSIRTTDNSSNYLILSQSLLDAGTNNLRSLSVAADYLYIPFVWLNGNISITIQTGSNNSSQSLYGAANHANRREWLEKHYNDELNKESNPTFMNEPLESNERQCSSLKRAALLKTSLSLPDTYFKTKSAICFCNSCRSPMSGSANLGSENCEVLIKGDPAKEFRLPLGWVKYNIRLKREVRCCLSLWHLAYLTVSPVLYHRLLSSSDPVTCLKYDDHSLSSAISWLNTSTNDNDGDLSVASSNRLPIIISPWQPLIGCYLDEDKCIRQCPDAELTYYDQHLRSATLARVALEVRVKPHSYQSMECKVVSSNNNGTDDKCLVTRDCDGENFKKSVATTETASSRTINPKTVWILNGDANSVVISGLLIKII